jgi:hypothetical protein
VTAELAGVEPGTRPSDYLGALDAALDLLQRAEHGHREIHLIGDLQVAEIDTTRRSALARRFADEPSTRIYLRGVSVDPFVNRQVEPVEVPAAMLRAQETTAIAVRVRQDGGEALRVPLFLSVDDVTVGETELEIPARSTGEYSFPLTLPGEGSLGASVRVRPDRYPLDDEAWFVLDVNKTIETLVLRGVEGETGERDPLLFLNAALDPEQQAPGRFHPRVVDAARFDPVDLQKVGVVIAVDPRDLGSARLSVLSDYLEQGGTLLTFVGDPRVRTYLNDRLLPAWGELRLGSFRGGEEVFERLEVAAPDHPVFEGLEPEALATIEEVRLRNFYRIEGEADRVLLRYAGGGTAAAEIEVGRGRVILCGFDTAAVSGDLPWSPMFLPLVQRLTGYLATAGWGRFGRHFDTGQALVVAAPEGIGAAEEWTLVAPDGSRTRAELDASALPPRVRHAGVAAPGIYRFERSGATATSIAVNVPRTESTPATWSPEEFAAAMGGGSDRVRWGSLDGEDAAQALRDARTGHGVHRWFLWIALFLLAIESLISRRVGTTSAARSERPAS